MHTRAVIQLGFCTGWSIQLGDFIVHVYGSYLVYRIGRRYIMSPEWVENVLLLDD